ncbi:NUDIX domain-containing protein [Streptomyces sp. NPDC058000]|uniref:NUDIX domain-containing protein n=1 Tax=Streptomyces sp. NPDC058000 TaxID=3346299 RepID=UPI0036E88F9B
MSSVHLRRAVRAVVLDEDDRVLLCRFAVPEPVGTVVWAAPGGGVECGETPLAALRPARPCPPRSTSIPQ